MDRLMGLVVRFLAALAKLAPLLAKVGLVEYSRYDGTGKVRILLVGYNGARNTGADVRVATMVEQLEGRFGREHVDISVMTLDEENVSCYFGPHVTLVPFSSIFFWDLFRACCAAHMVVLSEGSTLKSKFANALTLFFCEAAGIMKAQGKPCIAYGSEAGAMDGFLERIVKKLCSETYFIARAQSSLDHIRRLGLKGHLGTDTAWTFDSSSHAAWARDELRRQGWDGASPLLGIAAINPFWWPVKPSLAKWLRAAVTGEKSLQFQKWYFFSWNKHREAQLERYLDSLAQAARRQVELTGCHVVLIGMERLDTDAIGRLRQKLGVNVSVLLAQDHNGYEMAAVLRQLSWLVTSRFHAQVLSMAGSVPSVAVSMDERLANIMADLGVAEHQLLQVDDPQLAAKLEHALDHVEAHRGEIAQRIEAKLPAYLATLNDMAGFAQGWLYGQLGQEKPAQKTGRAFEAAWELQEGAA